MDRATQHVGQHDGTCAACNAALLADLKRQATPQNIDLLELPCAAGLIAQAEALSVSTGEPCSMSLRRIVDDFSGAAAIASSYFAEKESA